MRNVLVTGGCGCTGTNTTESQRRSLGQPAEANTVCAA